MAMENSFSFKILIIIVFFSSIIISFPTAVTSISTRDLDSLLIMMRVNGHSLFANAISTSDLLFDILSLPSLTLLAPTDPSVFALDMLQTPPFYLSNLRLHIIPLRLSWSNLRRLPNGSSIPTALPSHQLSIIRRRVVGGGHAYSIVVGNGGDEGVGIGAERVEVVMPGLYYGRHVAVHGLSGILTLRSKIVNDFLSPTIPRNDRNLTFEFPPVPRFPPPSPAFRPRTPGNMSPPVNRTGLTPFPKTIDNNTSRATSSPVNSTVVISPTVAENNTVLAPDAMVSEPDATMNAPAAGPSILNSYSPADLPDDRYTFNGNFDGLDFSPVISPSPGPLRPTKDL